MEVMYWYALAPVVLVFGTLVFVISPFLALGLLAVVTFGVLAALAWAIVAVPYMLGRAVSHRWQARGSSST